MEVHKQIANGEVPNLKPTGDAKLDAAFTTPINVVFQDVAGYLSRMEAEVARLQQEDAFSHSLLSNQSSIESEIRKRIQSQEIIARYKKGFPAPD